MNSSKVIFLLAILLFVSFINIVNAQNDEQNKKTGDELNDIVLHSFEHFDYLDILYKLKGHNSDMWIVLFYIDEDHHKDTRDRLKKLIFEDNPDFRYAEANISKPNYKPIKQAIRFPQNAGPDDFPMVLIMKNQVGKMAYGPGVARKAADIVAELKQREDLGPSEHTESSESNQKSSPQLKEPEKSQ